MNLTKAGENCVFQNCVAQTYSQLRTMNAKAGDHRRSEQCGLDVTVSVRYDWSAARQGTFFPLRPGISGILPYKHVSRLLEIFSACTELSHGSIMLPPHQPCVFARLARWQIFLARLVYLCH